jgi:hypothetical protein
MGLSAKPASAPRLCYESYESFIICILFSSLIDFGHIRKIY